MKTVFWWNEKGPLKKLIWVAFPIKGVAYFLNRISALREGCFFADLYHFAS